MASWAIRLLFAVAICMVAASAESRADSSLLREQSFSARCDLVRRIVAYIPLSEDDERLTVPLAASACAKPKALIMGEPVVDAIIVFDDGHMDAPLFREGEECTSMGFKQLSYLKLRKESLPEAFIRIALKPSGKPLNVRFSMNIGETYGSGFSSCGETHGLAERMPGGWNISPFRLDGSQYPGGPKLESREKPQNKKNRR